MTGESVLNDAVAIVLFRVLTQLHGGDAQFTFDTIPSVLGKIYHTILPLPPRFLGDFEGGGA